MKADQGRLQLQQSLQSIILDIPDITMAELIDRFSRGLKSYIWNFLCLNNHDTLHIIMLDALKVEAAKRGTRRVAFPDAAATGAGAGTPMDLSNVQIGKLTPEERKRCMSEGLCRSREKGYLAEDCPRGRGN